MNRIPAKLVRFAECFCERTDARRTRWRTRGPGVIAKANEFTVERIDGIEHLCAVGPEYDRLVADAPDMKALFYSRGWLERIHQDFDGPRKRACFLLARENGKLVAVAPLHIETKDWSRAHVRRLYFYGHWDGTLSNGLPGFVIPDPHHFESSVRAFLDFITGPMRDDWDHLELAYFPQDSIQLWLALTELPDAKAEAEDLVGHIADLEPGYDHFYRALPRNLRQELRRRRRRLEDSGLDIRFGQTDRLTPSQLSRAAAIHHARQQCLRSKGIRRDSVFMDRERTAATFRSLLDYAADRGFARHYFVELDGELAACQFCFSHGRTLVQYMSAFDPQYAKYAPLKLLQLYLFQRETEDFQTRWVNMLPGTNRRKSEFAPNLTRYLNVAAVNTQSHMARLKHTWLITTQQLRDPSALRTLRTVVRRPPMPNVEKA